MMNFTRCASASLVLLAAACSGNVVVDGPSDSNGGTGGTSTSIPTGTTGTTFPTGTTGTTFPTGTTTTFPTGTTTGTTGTTTTGTTTTGTTTTGTTGTTTTGTVGTNCIGPFDAQTIQFKPTWNALVSCALQYIENEPSLYQCIQASTGLSSGCTACCDAYVHCTIQACLSPCAGDPNGPSCADCRKQSCDGSFISCAGVPFVPHP